MRLSATYWCHCLMILFDFEAFCCQHFSCSPKGQRVSLRHSLHGLPQSIYSCYFRILFGRKIVDGLEVAEFLTVSDLMKKRLWSEFITLAC